MAVHPMRVAAATLLLLVLLATPSADAYSYAGRLMWAKHDVGAPEQLRLTHTADPAERFNASCGALDRTRGVTVSWVAGLAQKAAPPQVYTSVQGVDGDNASAYYAEAEVALGAYATNAAFLAAPRSMYTAYANIRAENRCGTLRLMSSVPISLAAFGPDAPFTYRVRNVERRGANNTMYPVNDWSPATVGRVPRVVGDEAAGEAPLPPTSFGIVADMSDYMSTQGEVNAIQGMADAAAAGEISAVVHIGDIAYDIDDDCGARGDEFMNRVQRIAAHVPYVFGPGDHEGGRKSLQNTNCGGDYEMFMHKLGEGQGALARASGSPTLFYFSFDIERVHFVSINANAWVYACQYWMLQPMTAWLERDLAAVNRTKTPWVIVLAHRQAYCVKSDDAECNQEARALRYGVPQEAYNRGLNMGNWADMGRDVTGAEGNVYGLEEILKKHRVDIMFGGHTHHYERSWPVYRGAVTQYNYVDPKAPVYVQGGICGVTNDAFVLPQSEFEAWRDEEYLQSWGHVTAYNATHLTWTQVRADGKGVLDTFMIAKRAPSAASAPAASPWWPWNFAKAFFVS